VLKVRKLDRPAQVMTASSRGAGRCEVIEAYHNIGCSLTLIVGGDSYGRAVRGW